MSCGSGRLANPRRSGTRLGCIDDDRVAHGIEFGAHLVLDFGDVPDDPHEKSRNESGEQDRSHGEAALDCGEGDASAGAGGGEDSDRVLRFGGLGVGPFEDSFRQEVSVWVEEKCSCTHRDAFRGCQLTGVAEAGAVALAGVVEAGVEGAPLAAVFCSGAGSSGLGSMAETSQRPAA